MNNESPSPILTIYIMAYENAECVKELMNSLMLSSSNDFVIMVADNSDISNDVKDTVEELANRFQNRVFYNRFRFNVGLSGSIVKSFEMLDSDYIWILGACNKIRLGSIENILDVLKSNSPDALMIFENNLWRTKIINNSVYYDNYKDLLLDHSLSVIYSINSTIYSTEKFRKLLWVAYEGASSYGPHVAMLIEGLRSKAIRILYVPIFAVERPIRPRIWSTRKFFRCLTSTFPGHVKESEIQEFLDLIRTTDSWIFDEVAKLNSDPDYGYGINNKLYNNNPAIEE